jgi:hypothetical protein
MSATSRLLDERRQVHALRGASRWPTPRALRGLLYAIWAGAALLFLISERSLERGRASLHIIGKDAAVGILAAQEIKAHLADLDANGAVLLLGSTAQADVATQLFEYRRSAVTRRLIDAAQSISAGEDERILIVAVSENLGRYLVAMGDARAQHARGDARAALEAYRAATDLMHLRLLPAAESLDAVNQAQMDAAYRVQASASKWAEVLAVMAGGALLVALIAAQIFLLRRTRRIVNPALLLATVLALAASGYLIDRFGAAREDLRVAKEDAFESIHALWRLRAVAYDATGVQGRFLLDRERRVGFAQAYTQKLSLISSAPELPASARAKLASQADLSAFPLSGLAGDIVHNLTFRGERAAVGGLLDGLTEYVKVDRQLHGLDAVATDAKHLEAVALYLGRSNEAFNHFDASALRALSINKQVFDELIDEGDRGLKTAELLDPLLAAAIALLGWLGLRRRIQEYR